jgi:hypothetical protein
MTTTEDANMPFVTADVKLAEHRDVIQDKADQTQSRNGVPMFGDSLPRTQSAATTSAGKTQESCDSDPAATATLSDR